MEPRPYERGNTVGRSLRAARSITSFNGATSLRTWKQATRTRRLTTSLWLQWSHVLTNVETEGAGDPALLTKTETEMARDEFENLPEFDG